MPRHQDLNWKGLDFKSDVYDGLMAIDREKGKEEAESQKELFASFEDRLPPEMEAQRKALLTRLAEAPAVWHVTV
jgi:phosphoenolpyruvate carboxykinase (GTP)